MSELPNPFAAPTTEPMRRKKYDWPMAIIGGASLASLFVFIARALWIGDSVMGVSLTLFILAWLMAGVLSWHRRSESETQP